MSRITRRNYAATYGPTTGDCVRLADTDLQARVERDFTIYGEEIKFGGGKVIRDGMGQSSRATRADGVLDTVITNALILDYWGIVKADIGLRDGKIVGIGKAGNPDCNPACIPIWLSARPPKLSRAKAASSRRAPSTATFTLFARSKSKSLWRRESRR